MIPNNEKIILDLCGGTGSWSKPYKEASYDVHLITLPEYDVRCYDPPGNVYGILAAPPCTMFSLARNDKTAKKPRDFIEGLEIVHRCLKIIEICNMWHWNNSHKLSGLKFWAMENPRGYLTNFIGLPAFQFVASEFGDFWRKRTYIWGRFHLPKKQKQESLIINNYSIPRSSGIDVIHSCLNIPQNRNTRAITPPGFSRAFFKANR